jgi:hypothetical protein
VATNPERDIIGYQVFDAGADNAVSSGDTPVCQTSDVTTVSCSHGTPPSAATSYYVLARDRTDLVDVSSLPRTSQFAAVVAVPSSAPSALLPPTGLAGTADPSTGNPNLSWTHVNPAGVSFFRIYRDNCCRVADRYDATSGNAFSWTDPRPGTTNRAYWVTAVGPNLNESPPSNRFDWVQP